VPTILRMGPYRFLFHSREHEPPHVHVESPDGWAVFDIAPVEFRRGRGYTRRELHQLHEVVVIHQTRFLRRWDEHFGG
jgi:hypothetical protein